MLECAQPFVVQRIVTSVQAHVLEPVVELRQQLAPTFWHREAELRRGEGLVQWHGSDTVDAEGPSEIEPLRKEQDTGIVPPLGHAVEHLRRGLHGGRRDVRKAISHDFVRHALRLEYDSRATRSVDALDARILAHEDGVLHERSRRGEVEAAVALRYANHTRGHVDLPRLEAGEDALPGPCDDPVGEPLVVRDGADEVDIESGGLTVVVDELEGR